ncbi:MAG: M23 family metallopeptidase [Desulfovibrionales bacterium]
MKTRKAFLTFVLCLPLAALLIFWLLLDRTPPSITVKPEQGVVSQGTSFTLDVQDADSGLRQVEVTAVQGDDTFSLLSRTFDSPSPDFNEEFTLEGSSLEDGEFSLSVLAIDASKNNWTKGNKEQAGFNMRLDSKPPSVSVLNATRYVYQGGAAAVSYTISEESAKTGVSVGDFFFPGYEYASGSYLCFYAYPHSLPDSDTSPTLTAEDEAGNLTRIGVPVYVKNRGFKKDRLTISDRFLRLKMPQFANGNSRDPKELLQVFLRVNEELRAEDNRTVMEVGTRTSAELMWEGSFIRLPNSARRAGFGDHRTYVYNGERVDETFHLGIDLASLARSRVPAANNGRVVYADSLGIYGQTVILDHGFGVQSLYSHLSEIKVGVGEAVKKGRPVGLTGETGMALGDHLHFGMMVSGIPVTPIEWWDPKWIQERIAPCLDDLASRE